MRNTDQERMWLGVVFVLSLMIVAGCDSGASGGGCGDTPPPPATTIFEGDYTIENREDLEALAGYKLHPGKK